MRSPSRRGLLVIAFTAFILLGLPDGMLGTSWPFARVDFDRDIDQLAVLIAAGVGGYGLASFFSGPVQQRLRRSGSLVAAFVLNAVAFTGIATASSWWIVVAAALVWGFGSGLMDPVVNGYVARNHSVRVMNLLHASYGVGATTGPVLVVWAIDLTGTWRAGFGVLAGLSLLMLLVMVAARRAWDGGPKADDDHGARPPVDTGVALILLGFAASTGIEVGVGHWAFTILTDGRHMPDAVAAGFVAGYWGGLTAGRLLGALVGNPRGPAATAVASGVVLVVGAAWFWADPGGFGAFGLPLQGMGVALMFPGLVLVTPRIVPSGTDHVLGWGFAAAAAGAVVVPWMLGRVALISGAAQLPTFLVGVAAVAAIANAVVTRWPTTDRIRGLRS